jgi:transcriptional regulator with XRE-family HTH domain
MLDPAVTGDPERERRSRPLLRTMLGEVLRRARREQGRTLADVARAARVSLQYLSELERGRKEASSEVLAAICDALGIELADVLAEVGHDLTMEQARRTRVIRLEAIREQRIGRRASDPFAGGPFATGSPAGGPADAQCLLAA